MENLVKIILEKNKINFKQIKRSVSGFSNIVYFVDDKYVIKLCNEESRVLKLQNLQESPLMQMIKSGEIKQYYTGRIITGVELDCLIDGAQNYSSNGYGFNGYIIHVLTYGFDIEKITEPGMFFNEQTREQYFYEDMETLKNGLKEQYDFDFPADLKLVYGVPYPDQLYAYLQAPEHADVKKELIEELSLDEAIFEAKSSFARTLTNSKDGAISKILHRKQKTLSKMQDAIKLAEQTGESLVLAHPAKMNGQYNVKDYI